MCSTSEWTVIGDEYPSKRYVNNYEGYMRSNGKAQKNIINAIDFLTRCDCGGAVLVVVVSEWKHTDSSTLLKLFPELAEIHIWTREKCHEVVDDKIKIRYNRPGRLSYSDVTQPTLLICSIRCDGPLSTDEEVEAQNLVLNNVNPVAASLKFRPAPSPKRRSPAFTFYSGVVSTVCYSRACSLEAKIFVTQQSEVTNYNINKYRCKMFYYNTEVRFKVIDGLSFDEYYCLSILTDYITARGLDKSAMNLWSDIISMIS